MLHFNYLGFVREIPLQLFKCTLHATAHLQRLATSFVEFSNETDSVTDLLAALKYQMVCF